jgi:hypothetical protein
MRELANVPYHDGIYLTPAGLIVALADTYHYWPIEQIRRVDWANANFGSGARRHFALWCHGTQGDFIGLRVTGASQELHELTAQWLETLRG